MINRMSERATKQSVACSLAHIYKPDPVAADWAETTQAGRTWSVAGAEPKCGLEGVSDLVQSSIQ